jgi:ABC-2 type transport system permease protein
MQKVKSPSGGFLAPYRAMFHISFKSSFAYRSSILTRIVGSVFTVVAQIAVWTFVFRRDPAMVGYMTRYVVVSQALGMLLDNNVTRRIGTRVASGDFAIDLIKPASSVAALWSASFGETASALLTQALPVLLAFSPALLGAGIPVTRLPLFILLAVLALALSSLMFVLLGYLSFVVLEVWPFVRLLNDTIRLLAGAVIPLSFFPPFLRSVAGVLPFQYLYSLPLRSLLEDLPRAETLRCLFVMGAWIAGLALLTRAVAASAVRRIVVQGG